MKLMIDVIVLHTNIYNILNDNDMLA